jgi:hypothetical protein
MTKWTAPEVSNQEKEAVWQAHRERKPIRVPVAIASNPRIIVLNPRLNASHLTFEQMFHDPRAMMQAALEHEHYRRTDSFFKRFRSGLSTINVSSLQVSWATPIAVPP